MQLISAKNYDGGLFGCATIKEVRNQSSSGRCTERQKLIKFSNLPAFPQGVAGNVRHGAQYPNVRTTHDEIYFNK